MGNADRTKLLVHLRRINGVFDRAIREGPDGSLEGRFRAEHETFTHHSLCFYLVGCMAYLEGEDGAGAWKKAGQAHSNFDGFASSHPPRKKSFSSRGITMASLDALVCIRNAVVHNDGDLAKNQDSKSLTKVTGARLPGVILKGSVVKLEHPFLEFVRLSTLAVRQYHGDG